MRDYSKISPQFWLCDIGRKLRTIGSEAQLVALYLMSSPHSTMTGIYYIPYLLIAHETGLTEEKVRAVMQQLIDCQFCSYDEQYEFVWVHEMARCQIAPQLKPNDNRVKTVNKFLNQLPKLSFLDNFYHAYQEDFHLKKNNMTDSEIVISTKKILEKHNHSTRESMDKDTNEIIELQTSYEETQPEPPFLQKEIKEEVIELPPGISPSMWISAQCIFEQWKTLSHQPDAQLSTELLKAIHRVLVNGFTEQQLMRACEVCIERNPKATDFELLHLFSQRTLLEEALGIHQPRAMSEMAYQFLDSMKGGDYGAESTSEF